MSTHANHDYPPTYEEAVSHPLYIPPAQNDGKTVDTTYPIEAPPPYQESMRNDPAYTVSAVDNFNIDASPPTYSEYMTNIESNV